MASRINYILYILICLCLLVSPSCIEEIKAKEFVVVIDPGHGGHDPGAIGKISKEKDINLNVALKLGNLIKSNCNDTKVVYTRNRDVFITLDRRAEIANNAKADLFISIHTNAVEKNKTIQGASTWTLGLARSEANLAVAKRENSVILYEDDYKSRYADFDPNSSESYIIFEFMQDKYMEQSVNFASIIQKHFQNTCKRMDRGVHQAGFLVLKASAMPSVLVELGFISTPEEERYLNTDEGTSNLARGIYRAFLQYKNNQQNKLSGISTNIPEQANETIAEEETIIIDESPIVAEVKPDTNSKRTVSKKPISGNKTATPTPVVQAISSSKNIVFKVQILTASTVIDQKDKRFKGLKGVEYYKDGNIYKYTYTSTTDYNEALRTRRSIAENFKGAFVVAFKDGKRIDVNAAIAESKKK